MLVEMVVDRRNSVNARGGQVKRTRGAVRDGTHTNSKKLTGWPLDWVVAATSLSCTCGSHDNRQERGCGVSR